MPMPVIEQHFEDVSCAREMNKVNIQYDKA